MADEGCASSFDKTIKFIVKLWQMLFCVIFLENSMI